VRRPATERLAWSALVALVLGGGAACNQLSGAAAIDFTAGGIGSCGTVGDAGVECFNLVCDGGDVAVGVHGFAGSVLNQIELSCASLQAGGALGTPYSTAVFDSTVSPTYQASCGAGEAVVGLSYTRGAQFVDQVTLSCQAPSAWQAANSTSQAIAPVGSNDGSGAEVPLPACPHGQMVHGLPGQLGSANGGVYVQDFGAPECVPGP